MPDLLSMRDQSELRSLHEGDIVFVPGGSLWTFNYETNSFDGETLLQGQYHVGSRGKLNGVDIRYLGQPYLIEGKGKIQWFSVRPESQVYLLEESSL